MVVLTKEATRKRAVSCISRKELSNNYKLERGVSLGGKSLSGKLMLVQTRKQTLFKYCFAQLVM